MWPCPGSSTNHIKVVKSVIKWLTCAYWDYLQTLVPSIPLCEWCECKRLNLISLENCSPQMCVKVNFMVKILPTSSLVTQLSWVIDTFQVINLSSVVYFLYCTWKFDFGIWLSFIADYKAFFVVVFLTFSEQPHLYSIFTVHNLPVFALSGKQLCAVAEHSVFHMILILGLSHKGT